MTTLLQPIQTTRRRAISGLAFTLFGFFALAGCGGEPTAVALPNEPLHPVTGKVVTVEDKPLTEGVITFVPVKGTTTREASAKIGPDGTFTLKSGDAGEGAAEGDYRVKIESPLTVAGTDPKKPIRVVPLAYEDEDSSQLKITIKSGSNSLPPIKLVPVDPRKSEAASSRD
jgi:hypothetical protein